MLDSLNLIKNKAEEGIIGQANSQIYMKGNLKQEKEMEEGHSGGLMVVGMKASLRMGFNVDMESYIGMVDR